MINMDYIAHISLRANFILLRLLSIPYTIHVVLLTTYLPVKSHSTPKLQIAFMKNHKKTRQNN